MRLFKLQFALLFAAFSIATSVLAQDSYKEHYNEGVRLFQMAQYPQAIAALNKAIEIKNNDPDAWYNRATAKFMTQDYMGAFKDYTQALKLNPEFVDAWYNRGQVQSYLNDPVGVVDDMTEVLTRDPEYVDAYAMRGQHYFYIENHVEGCRDLKTAYEMGFAKSKSQLKLYCNVPTYFTDVPVKETFELDWNSKGNWQQVDLKQTVRKQETTFSSESIVKRRAIVEKNLVNIPMEDAVQRYVTMLGKDCGKVSHKIIDQGKQGDHAFALFSVECSQTKLAQLWYLFQGDRALYVSTLEFPDKKLKSDTIKSWQQFFSTAKLKIERA